MNRTQIAFVLGGVAVALGIVVAVEPSLAAGIGTGETMLGAVALVAGYLAYGSIRARLRAKFEQPSMPDVESKYDFVRPGTTFTDSLTAASASKRADGRERIREELHDLTVDVLTTYQGYSESDAEAAIDDGTWTEDPYAAAFFTFELPERSLRGRFGDAVEGRVAFERRAKRVIAELAAITEEL